MASRAKGPEVDAPFDVAFIRLPNNTFDTSKLPGFAVGVITSASRKLVGNSGYPRDKDSKITQQWYSTGLLVDGVNPDYLFYDNDTYGGNSGSVVFVLDEVHSWRVVGIHNGIGVRGISNSAAKITSRLMSPLNHAPKGCTEPSAIDYIDNADYSDLYFGPIDHIDPGVGYVDTHVLEGPQRKIVVEGNLREKMNRVVALELWAANPDGSGLERLVNDDHSNDHYFSVKEGKTTSTPTW